MKIIEKIDTLLKKGLSNEEAIELYEQNILKLNNPELSYWFVKKS